MGLFYDVLLTIAWALGLSFVVWSLFGRLLRPGIGDTPRIVIPGRGDGGDLEQTVRGFIWLRGAGLLSCPIVIADVDLTPQGWEVALRLTVRWPSVILWPAGELPDYIARIK